MLVKFYIVLLLGVRSIQHLLPYSLLNQTITAQFQGLSDFTIECKIVKNHTSIVVLGVNGRRELSIVGYSLVRGEWNDSVYYYGSSVTIEGKMYEGSVKQTLLSIEQIPAINSSLANIHFVN